MFERGMGYTVYPFSIFALPFYVAFFNSLFLHLKQKFYKNVS